MAKIQHDLWQQSMLSVQDPVGETVCFVALQHGHKSLRNNWTAVELLVDKVNGCAMHTNTRLKRALMRLKPWKGREQGGVYVDQSPGETLHKSLRQNTHKARKHNQIGVKVADYVS
jgi:hypothetical protein